MTEAGSLSFGCACTRIFATKGDFVTAVVGDGQDAILRDYVRVVWRRRLIVVGVAVLLAASALAYSLVKSPLYKASAQLIYENQLDVADPLSTGGYVDAEQRQLELASVEKVIASPEVVRSAETLLLADKGNLSSYTVSAVPDTQSSSSGSNTVSITAVSPSADTAARVANSYAVAFTASRKAREQARVRQAVEVVERRIDSYQSASQRQSPEYLTLQQRLQDLLILEATVTGNFRVLAPATVPTTSFSPMPVRNALVGFVAGLVIGVGFVLLLGQFDTRVRTEDEAGRILDMPLLGQIRRIPAKTLDQQPLVVLNSGHDSAAEAMRKLRGSLQFTNVDGDVKSLFITSCLQHEGKSLTACNLALAFAAAGTRVVLVDGDLRRPQVHRYLNLPNATGLSTVLSGRTDLLPGLRAFSLGRSPTRVGPVNETAANQVQENRLYVLTSGPVPPNPAEMIASKSFAALVDELQGAFDLVIIDAPALLAVGDTAAVARCVDGLVFLADLTRSRRPLLVEAAKQVAQMPCRKLGLVVLGRSPSRREERDYYSYYAHGE